MKTYLKCLGAYLTGWCIVQPTYNRIHKYMVHKEMANPSIETKAWWYRQAVGIVDEMESRSRQRAASPDENYGVISEKTALVLTHMLEGTAPTLNTEAECDEAASCLRQLAGWRA